MHIKAQKLPSFFLKFRFIQPDVGYFKDFWRLFIHKLKEVSVIYLVANAKMIWSPRRL